MNPLYPALKRLPFPGFQSSLIADRRGSAIRPATQNPAKGKPLLRQGTDGNFHSGLRVHRIFTFDINAKLRILCQSYNV
ncbi:MAG: hypothetical protein JRI35_06455 [Deltaproteobacteria bacterium]|nr:hypothetical protein [Deltaproteobacteria bacterium]